MAAFTVRSPTPVATLLFILAVTVFVALATGGAASSEYQSMQHVLRNRGYAMAATALKHQILTLPPNASYTIFAPTDASMFAFNRIETAAFNTETIRLHVIPLRLSLSQLQTISSGYILPTLLPYRALRLTNAPLRVAGVAVADTGIFYSRTFAVHGIDGIIDTKQVFYYGGGAVDGVKAEDTAEDEKLKAEAEKTRAEAEKIRAEAQKMREEKMWITNKKAKCIAWVMLFGLMAAFLVWAAIWVGLWGDVLCGSSKKHGLAKGKLRDIQEAMTADEHIRVEIEKLMSGYQKKSLVP